MLIGVCLCVYLCEGSQNLQIQYEALAETRVGGSEGICTAGSYWTTIPIITAGDTHWFVCVSVYLCVCLCEESQNLQIQYKARIRNRGAEGLHAEFILDYNSHHYRRRCSSILCVCAWEWGGV